MGLSNTFSDGAIEHLVEEGSLSTEDLVNQEKFGPRSDADENADYLIAKLTACCQYLFFDIYGKIFRQLTRRGTFCFAQMDQLLPALAWLELALL